MRRKSEITKKRLCMGTGTGANYKPYIQVGEFGSKGTAVKAIDWKTGRAVHLMSQTEYYVWLMLRFDDDNLDIREQFPLDQTLTEKIAEVLGIVHPSYKDELITMTSDFLVTRENKDVAISVKYNIDEVKNSQRTIEKLYIEKQYWKIKNTDYKLITLDDIDLVYVDNIRDVTEHYNDKEFADEITFAKFLISHKLIKVDMRTKINYEDIISGKEFKQWTTLTLQLEAK